MLEIFVEFFIFYFCYFLHNTSIITFYDSKAAKQLLFDTSSRYRTLAFISIYVSGSRKNTKNVR